MILSRTSGRDSNNMKNEVSSLHHCGCLGNRSKCILLLWTGLISEAASVLSWKLAAALSYALKAIVFSKQMSHF